MHQVSNKYSSIMSTVNIFLVMYGIFFLAATVAG